MQARLDWQRILYYNAQTKTPPSQRGWEDGVDSLPDPLKGEAGCSRKESRGGYTYFYTCVNPPPGQRRPRGGLTQPLLRSASHEISGIAHLNNLFITLIIFPVIHRILFAPIKKPLRLAARGAQEKRAHSRARRKSEAHRPRRDSALPGMKALQEWMPPPSSWAHWQRLPQRQPPRAYQPAARPYSWDRCQTAGPSHAR